MAGKKGMTRYTVEVKTKAVQMYFIDGYRKEDIKETLGIKHNTQLESWFRQFRIEGYSGLELRKKGRKTKQKEDKTALERIEELEMKVELLQCFLEVKERK